ncbi:MAG: DUF1682 domain-containing protein [Oceanospirillales bacterium]|nr:DUF1682 domain-containing protein [Oceanospirillales bacterium]
MLGKIAKGIIFIVLSVTVLPWIIKTILVTGTNTVSERKTDTVQSAIQSATENQQRYMEELQKKQAEQAEIAHQRRIAEEQAKLDEIERLRRLKKLSSSECQFWKHYYETKNTERSLEKVKEYCYL